MDRTHLEIKRPYYLCKFRPETWTALGYRKKIILLIYTKAAQIEYHLYVNITFFKSKFLSNNNIVLNDLFTMLLLWLLVNVE